MPLLLCSPSRTSTCAAHASAHRCLCTDLSAKCSGSLQRFTGSFGKHRPDPQKEKQRRERMADPTYFKAVQSIPLPPALAPAEAVIW